MNADEDKFVDGLIAEIDGLKNALRSILHHSTQTLADAQEIAEQALEEVDFYQNDAEPDGCDESMDGDHQSALASAGWGDDEDYGSYDSLDDW